MSTPKRFDVSHRPTAGYTYWLFDPWGDGMTYYRTAQERDEAGAIAVAAYLDGGWDEDVEHVAAGEVTHSAQVLHKRMRPPQEDLDDESCDGEGTHWPAEIEWRGNYKLEPLTAAEAQQPAA